MHAYRKNHYEELGVPRSADPEAIRVAYRALAKQLHPDLTEAEGLRDTNEPFLRLQQAYDVLRDPLRRAQYDYELAREAAKAAAAREAMRQPLVVRPTPKPPVPLPLPPGPPRMIGLRRYIAALGLVAIVAVGITAWQLWLKPKPQPILIVRVDPEPRSPRLPRGGPGGAEPTAPAPAEPGALAREVDRIVQSQVERVEAAKRRMEEQLSELEARKPPASGSSPRKPPVLLASHVQCIGRGTNIVLTKDNDGAKVSYDNGPMVAPRISDLGTGTVLVSRIEPTNKIAIGFTKGDRNGTKLLMFDQAGSVQQTFNVECTAAAF